MRQKKKKLSCGGYFATTKARSPKTFPLVFRLDRCRNIQHSRRFPFFLCLLGESISKAKQLFSLLFSLQQGASPLCCCILFCIQVNLSMTTHLHFDAPAVLNSTRFICSTSSDADALAFIFSGISIPSFLWKSALWSGFSNSLLALCIYECEFISCL